MSIEIAGKKKEFPECFIFDGKIFVPLDIAEKINERVKIHAKEPSQEWICVLTGESRFVEGKLVEVVKDFFELPTYNPDKSSSLAISLSDIKKIVDEGYYVIGVLHSHPKARLEDLWPSLNYVATAICIDAMLGRPLKHIIMDSDGNKLILTFENCFKCENSFFKFLFKQKGGEKWNWEA